MSNEFEEIETLRCLLAGSRDRIKFLQGEIARFESIFEPTHLMCLRGGEKLLELCAPDGKFIGVSWNDMAQVLAAMVQASPIGSGKAPKIVDSLQAEIDHLKAELAWQETDNQMQAAEIDQLQARCDELGGLLHLARGAIGENQWTLLTKDIDTTLSSNAGRTNTSGKAHCPHDGICHASDETCCEAIARIAALPKPAGSEKV